MKDISTRVVKRDNKYFCFVDELSIVSEAESLSEAYIKVEKEIEDYFSKIKEFGLEEEYKSYSANAENSNEMLDFIKKMAVSGVFVVLFFALSGVAFGLSFKMGYNSISSYKAQKAIELKKDNKSNFERFKDKLNIVKPYLEEINKAFKE